MTFSIRQVFCKVEQSYPPEINLKPAQAKLRQAQQPPGSKHLQPANFRQAVQQ